METLLLVLKSVEFWMGLSLVATAVPGPQNRLLPALFKAVSRIVAAGTAKRG